MFSFIRKLKEQWMQAASAELGCSVHLLHQTREWGESTAASTDVTCLQLSLEVLESKSPSQVFPGTVRWCVGTKRVAEAEKRTGYNRQYLISASWDFSVVSILTHNIFSNSCVCLSTFFPRLCCLWVWELCLSIVCSLTDIVYDKPIPLLLINE